MRVSEEPNVDVLRLKAKVLESENERLLKAYADALRANLALMGMSPEAIELNLPGLLEQAAKGATKTKKAGKGSERRRRRAKDDDDGAGEGDEEAPKEKQRGHGPTKQEQLELVEETFDLDQADKVCTICGGDLDEWEGKADEIEVVDFVERKWVVKKCTLKKYRCQCGGCVQTADGPQKLIKGGRYTLDVAISSAVAKFVDHLPLDRQSRMAKRLGLEVTTQTLWDQNSALSGLLAPLCARIKAHVVNQSVIGTDLSPYKLMKKGGHSKWQVWQLSCPTAVYMEVLSSKKAEDGRSLYELHDDDGEVVQSFSGTAVMDGGAELLKIAKDVGFVVAGCWSHARRAVLKADVEAPGQVDQFLERVEKLYAIERKAIVDDVSRSDPRSGYRRRQDLVRLKALRETESREVTTDLKDWMLAQNCIPGGLLFKGLSYVQGRWSQLLRFLDDAQIPLDNNQTEKGFVDVALGRRNYVGSRSPRGAEAAGRFYTVFLSASVNGVDGERYVRYASSTLLNGDEPLLPHEWAAEQRAELDSS